MPGRSPPRSNGITGGKNAANQKTCQRNDMCAERNQAAKTESVEDRQKYDSNQSAFLIKRTKETRGNSKRDSRVRSDDPQLVHIATDWLVGPPAAWNRPLKNLEMLFAITVIEQLRIDLP